MDTKLDIHEIEYFIAKDAGWRNHVIIPNVSWGFFNSHEADIVILSPSGYLTEIEIKRSCSDLCNDFKKATTHYENKVENLYYAVPRAIAGKCWERIVESFHGNMPKCGVLTYTEGGAIDIYKKAPSLSAMAHKQKDSNRLFLEEQLKLARLGTMRYWSLAERVLDNKYNNKQTF